MTRATTRIEDAECIVTENDVVVDDDDTRRRRRGIFFRRTNAPKGQGNDKKNSERVSSDDDAFSLYTIFLALRSCLCEKKREKERKR